MDWSPASTIEIMIEGCYSYSRDRIPLSQLMTEVDHAVETWVLWRQS